MVGDAARHDVVVTIEDGFRQGGAGTGIETALRDMEAECKVEVMGVPVMYIPHAKPDKILSEFGLDAQALGFLTSTYFATFAAMQLVLGVALDRYGPRRVQTALLVVAALGSGVFAVAQDVATLESRGDGLRLDRTRLGETRRGDPALDGIA